MTTGSVRLDRSASSLLVRTDEAGVPRPCGAAAPVRRAPRAGQPVRALTSGVSRLPSRGAGPGVASCSASDIRLEAHSETTAVTASVPTMTTSDNQIGISGATSEGLAAVDERHLVLVHGVQDQLDADEGQQEGQAVGQVDQALQQAADEEVELAQAHQREDVGREHQVGLLGDAEDRRDRVQGEQQVGGAEGDDHDEQRRDHPLAVLLDEDAPAVPLLGGGEALLHPRDEAVLLELVVLVLGALLGQLDGGVDQEEAEEVEHPAEVVDGGRADGDEDRAHDQRHHDADHQGVLLELTRHRELAHDDDEDEQVVDRQRVLHQPAGVELQRVRAAGGVPDAQAEQQRQADIDRQVGGALLHARLVRATADDGEVEGEDDDGHHDGGDPDPGGYVHEAAPQEGSGVDGTGTAPGGRRRSLPLAPGSANRWHRVAGSRLRRTDDTTTGEYSPPGAASVSEHAGDCPGEPTVSDRRRARRARPAGHAPPSTAVSTQAPSRVRVKVCSKWADMEPSTVATVHSSSRRSVSLLPSVTIGSTARASPSTRVGPRPRLP